MSCNKVNNCKKYKMNIGNPNDWESPCNRCHYNISDYDIGYNKAIDDAKSIVLQTLENEMLVDTLHLRLDQLKAGGRE